MTIAHRGDWATLGNTAADKGESIHDDDTAKGMGFEGAFVPGTVVGAHALSAVMQLFGKDWMHGGWYSFKYATPVYTTEPVCVVAEEGDDPLVLRVETEDGRVCCYGRAGMGYALPWDPAKDGSSQPDQVFPEVVLGRRLIETPMVLTPAEGDKIADASADKSPWFTDDSVWGARIVHPEITFGHVLQVVYASKVPMFDGVTGPGIWAAHELRIREPLLFGKDYVIRQWIADKGRAGRTNFINYEFEILKDDEIVAHGRHKSKRMLV